jgi:hypothetical protein
MLVSRVHLAQIRPGTWPRESCSRSVAIPHTAMSPAFPHVAHRTRHGRRPRRLLTKCTPAAGVPRPIIDSCGNVPHVGDCRCWRPVSKKVLPWRSQKLAAAYDPKLSSSDRPNREVREASGSHNSPLFNQGDLEPKTPARQPNLRNRIDLQSDKSR